MSKNEWTYGYMLERITEHVNQILRENLYEMKLDKKQLVRLTKQKQELRDNLGKCGTGDELAKRYILEFLEECLLKLFHLNQNNIRETFFYQGLEAQNVEYIFDCLLFQYKRQHGKRSMECMLEDMMQQNPKLQFDNCIKEDELLLLWKRVGNKTMGFAEMLELLSLKIYSGYKGLGIIDELRDMCIDGVSGGVSGEEEGLRSVWIFYKGRSIQLHFLKFASMAELERICRNICRFEQPGELSKTKGYLVHEMADHSRVVVARPDFAESWMFFVRKLGQGEAKGLHQLFPTEDGKLVSEFLMWLMKGCQVVGITGMQGCGKTTLLMAMVAYIPKEYTLRVLELAFELHLRKIYPNRNVVTFRETDLISGWQGLEVQKKTDGAVSIIGEVASPKVAAWMVESGQVGSLFTIFTHHAKSTKSLVRSLRNSLLQQGGFQNEQIATEQVVGVVRFDIHLHLDRQGKRYVERITEIVEDTTNAEGYRTVDIIVYENGVYVLKHHLQEQTKIEMAKWMSVEEREGFFASVY